MLFSLTLVVLVALISYDPWLGIPLTLFNLLATWLMDTLDEVYIPSSQLKNEIISKVDIPVDTTYYIRQNIYRIFVSNKTLYVIMMWDYDNGEVQDKASVYVVNIINNVLLPKIKNSEYHIPIKKYEIIYDWETCGMKLDGNTFQIDNKVYPNSVVLM